MADLVFSGEPAAGPINSSAMPTNLDLVIYEGDFVEIFVTVKDSLGAPVSLAGSTPKAQLKTDYEDASPKAFATTLTGVTGQVRIYLSSVVCTTLVPGSYIWDFQITSPGGDTRTYFAGDVTVHPEVTT